MTKIFGNPNLKNQYLIDLINNTKINHYYIKNYKNFKDRILKDISNEDVVLDCGKAMREKFQDIKCKSVETLDAYDYGDHPDIIFDLCSESANELQNRYDKIICISVLQHVYDPFKAINNLKTMLKDGGVLYGMVPYIYSYHAPENLEFQDYFRFSKDSLAYLFREFKEVELFPIRGRVSSAFHYMFPGSWKKYLEKTRINILLDKFTSDTQNLKKCSGFNFIVKK